MHEFHSSTAMLILAVAGSFFLACVGLWILRNGENVNFLTFVGFLLTLFSIRPAYISIKLLVTRTPIIVITDKQIECVQWPFKSIQWENINAVSLTRIPAAGGYALNIEVKSQDQILYQLPVLKRILWKSARLFGLAPISINLSALKEAPKEIENIALAQLFKSSSGLYKRNLKASDGAPQGVLKTIPSSLPGFDFPPLSVPPEIEPAGRISGEGV